MGGEKQRTEREAKGKEEHKKRKKIKEWQEEAGN